MSGLQAVTDRLAAATRESAIGRVKRAYDSRVINLARALELLAEQGVGEDEGLPYLKGGRS